MFKKLIVYIMSAYIAFFPIYRANAALPLVAAAYAFDVAAPVAIRYLASEIAIGAVVKGLQLTVKSSNAYYSAVSKVSNSNFLKFFKSKSAIGAAGFSAVLAGLGYYVSDDAIMSGSAEIPTGDVAAMKGFYWSYRGRVGATISDAVGLVAASVPSQYYRYAIVGYQPDSSVEGLRTVLVYSTDGDGTNFHSGHHASLSQCDSESIFVSTCSDDYDTRANQGATVVPDSSAVSDIISYISKLSDELQKDLFADAEGLIYQELSDLLVTDEVPYMPDGKTPIPNMKDPAWTNAHQIATGQAQSSNPLSDNYVADTDWAEAYYLANDIANGNDYITGLNSGAVDPTISGEVISTDGNSTVNNVTDVSGIEARLDTSNTLTQGVIDEVAKINNSTVALNTAPGDSAKSFWTIKYPDSISGVLTKFINDMKKTPIFEWLNQFVIDVGVGSIPVFDVCFNTIANIDFGCYSLTADAYVWTAIKASMILLAVIVSRKIIFGG